MSDLLPLLRSQQWEIRLVCPIASPISERCKSSPKSDFFGEYFMSDLWPLTDFSPMGSTSSTAHRFKLRRALQILS